MESTLAGTDAYDAEDRKLLTTEAFGQPEERITGVVAYDKVGNPLQVRDGNGNITATEYNALNLPIKVTDAKGKFSTSDYYKTGKVKSTTNRRGYPNGAKEDYAYYLTNRIKSVTSSVNGKTISRFDYTYDQNGNRLTQDETRGARTIGTTYNYDTLDRLQNYTVTENGASTTTDYTFDGYNRATEKVTNGNSTKTKTYSYDETDWLTQTTDGTRTITYAYDNNGNTTTKTDSTDPDNPVNYSYDSRDKLTNASKGGTTLGNYSYNAQGYRIHQNSSDRGNVEYLYDGTAVIEERNGNGLLAHYRYADKLYSLTDGTSNQYYHLDALGSTTDLTDDSGATKASYFLNPWGMIVDSIGDSVNRRVFTGKEIDQNTGLIYFGARYYDPNTARFTTQDAYLGEQTTPPSLHRYLYAYSNPTVFIDLWGYKSIREMMGVDDKSVEKAASQDNSWWGAAKYAAKATGYKIWNGVTGGFLERQDARQEKLDCGQISNSDFWKGTSIDATTSIGTQLAAGGALGKAASAGGLAKTMATGAVVSGGSSLVEQTAQVATYHVTDGRLGQEKIDAGQIIESIESGALVAGGLYGAGKIVQTIKSGIAAGKAGGEAALTGEDYTARLSHEGKSAANSVSSDERRIFYVDPKGVAIEAHEGSYFRGTAVTPDIDNSISMNGFISGQGRGVIQAEGAAFQNDAPMMARILQYVEGKPFPRDSNFVGLKKIPHDALNTSLKTGKDLLMQEGAYLRLDEVNVQGLDVVNIENVYRQLNITPRLPLSVTGEVAVDGNIRADSIIRTHRLGK